MSTIGNTYDSNMANEGGVIYMDNDAKFSGANDEYTKNIGL